MGQQQSPTGSCLGRPEPAVRARVCVPRGLVLEGRRGPTRQANREQATGAWWGCTGRAGSLRWPLAGPRPFHRLAGESVWKLSWLGLGVVGDLRSWKMPQDGGMEEGLPRAG